MICVVHITLGVIDPCQEENLEGVYTMGSKVATMHGWGRSGPPLKERLQGAISIKGVILFVFAHQSPLS